MKILILLLLSASASAQTYDPATNDPSCSFVMPPPVMYPPGMIFPEPGAVLPLVLAGLVVGMRRKVGAK